MLAVPALAALLVPAGAAWADHTASSGASMNPWWEALLWGAAGLAVAMTVAIIAIAFTRDPEARGKDRRGPR